jgi:hypothetical protein
MLRTTVSRPVYLCIKPPGAEDNIFVTVTQMRVCRCSVSPQTRGWICHLQLLLAPANIVILGFESHWTHDHISTISDLRLSPISRSRSPYLYPPGSGWPSYTPRYRFPFRRLLRLAGPLWRYSNTLPLGDLI